MGDVIQFEGATLLDIPPKTILEGTLDEVDELESVVIVGWRKDGNLWIGSSIGDVASVYWLLSVARQVVFETGTGAE